MTQRPQSAEPGLIIRFRSSKNPNPAYDSGAMNGAA